MDYVFKEDDGDKLEFVGRFDELYRNDNDPWGQSGTEVDSSKYYQKSRNRTRNLVDKIFPKSILVVGCGIGYTMGNYRKTGAITVTGVDISKEAIKKAQSLFPDFQYFCGDIRDQELIQKLGGDRFEMVIFEQLLWYILEGLDNSLKNAHSLLQRNGMLIICNAFERNQRYGKDTINGYEGAVRYFEKVPNFELKLSQHYDDGFRNTDGHFCLKRI